MTDRRKNKKSGSLLYTCLYDLVRMIIRAGRSAAGNALPGIVRCIAAAGTGIGKPVIVPWTAVVVFTCIFIWITVWSCILDVVDLSWICSVAWFKIRTACSIFVCPVYRITWQTIIRKYACVSGLMPPNTAGKHSHKMIVIIIWCVQFTFSYTYCCYTRLITRSGACNNYTLLV